MLLRNAMQDIGRMREVTKSIVDSGDVTNAEVTVGTRPLNCDNSYFGSYSHYGIHHEMLNVSITGLSG